MLSTMENTSGATYKIVEATPDDAEAIFYCSRKAMGNTFLLGKVYPEDKAHLTSADDLTDWRIRRQRKAMQADDLIYFIAIPMENSRSKVIGYSGWYRPGHFSKKTLADTYGQPTIDGDANRNPGTAPHSSGAGEAPINGEQQSEGFPACMNVEVHKGFLTQMDDERKRIWGDNADYWYLGALAVDPEYQRKGIASALLKPGLEWADNDGIPTYLEATPAGALLYPKLGFEKVSEMSMFEGRYVMEFHIRPPPGAP